MRYDTATQEMQFEPPTGVDLYHDRQLPVGLDRAKGWGWCAASLTPDEQAKSDALRVIFADPIKLAEFNAKRIERGIKPVIFN